MILGFIKNTSGQTEVVLHLDRSPKWEANGSIARKPGYDDRCFHCNRPLNTKTSFWVNLSTRGYFLRADSTEPSEADGGESQGWFPIGYGCAKHFGKVYCLPEPPKGVSS
jgi:hypothetical protein